MMETKTCSKCKTEKAKSEFSKDKRSKDGLRSRCRFCISERDKVYRAAHREAGIENGKAYRAANRGAVIEKWKEYYAANREAIIENKRVYYAANKDAIKAQRKEHRKANAEAIHARSKAYREANSGAIREKRKAYYAENREDLNNRNKAYREDNPDYIRAYNCAYIKTRYETDAMFAFSMRVRRLILISLTKHGYSKKSRTHEILGCSFEEFKAHIENQFVEGMDWSNRSEWQLDHIYPVSKAVDEAHLIALNHYTNFQPLWASDNRLKSNKIPEYLVSSAQLT